MNESTSTVVAPPAADSDRFSRWLAAPSGRAVAVFALAYAVWQPIAHGILHLAFGDPVAFHSAGAWARFAVSVAALGALAGWVWHRSRRWPRGAWRRDGAEWGVPALALGAILAARRLPGMGAAAWVAVVVIGAAATGALLASLAQLLRPARLHPPEA